jgi:Protein of unknown function (DUF1236)
MSNRFMISVAALALVAGTGLANAQGTMNRDSGGAGAQPTQHSQPSGGAAERGGGMGKDSMSRDKDTVGQAGGSSSTKAGAAAEDKSSGAMKDEKSSGGAMNKNAAEDKAGATKGQRTDERTQGQQDKSKGMSSDNTTKSGQKDKDMKAEGNKSGASTNNAENRPGTGTSTDMKAEGRNSTSSSTTVGQAGAGAKLSTEQRTKITTVIRNEHVAPVTNVNFSIAVGTRIPRDVSYHVLPTEVVAVYPEWRGYNYVLVRDQILVIDPQTFEIVAILDV